MKTHFQNLFKYKDLFLELVKKDIKLKYRNSALGVLWSMLNPLLMMVVMSIVFYALFRSHIPNFPVYVLIGRIVYQFFSESTNFAMDSIYANSQLIQKVYVPKYFFPLSRICSTFITTLIAFFPLVLMMIYLRMPFHWNNLLIVLPLLILLGISAGVGLLLSSINVFFNDMKHIYSIFLLILMYLTPVFYPISIIPEKYMPIIWLNPLYPIVEMCRDVVMNGGIPDPLMLLLSVTYMVVYGGIGLFIFYKTQDRFIYHV